MVKKGNKQVNIVLNPKDIERLEFCKEKTGLKPTEIYRIALIDYYLKERKVD